MKPLFYGLVGDGHLGFKAYDSDKRSEEVLDVLEQGLEKLADLPVICFAGDLFDDTTVPNWIKRRLIQLKEKHSGQLWVICGGNHDSTKTYSSVSMLDVFGEVANVTVVNSFKPEVIGVPQKDGHELSILVIPHMKSQTLFLEAIDTLVETGLVWDVCLMHCMVASSLDLGPNDLNVDMYRLSQLAERCRHIWIGHQHDPKKILDNVWIPGGTLELNFGETGDKFVYRVEGPGDPLRVKLIQPRYMITIDLDWAGPVDMLDRLRNLREDTIYRVIVNGIPMEDYSSAKSAMDMTVAQFPGDLIYTLHKLGHKELQVTEIDARFDLGAEFQEFSVANDVPNAAEMTQRLEDAISEVLSEEEVL